MNIVSIFKFVQNIAGKLLGESNPIQRVLTKGPMDVALKDAESDNLLQRSWRPIIMLGSFLLILADSFGLVSNGLHPMFYEIVKVGTIGYMVVGRTLEKAIKSVWGK